MMKVLTSLMRQPLTIIILLSFAVIGGGWYLFQSTRTPAPVAPVVVTTPQLTAKTQPVAGAKPAVVAVTKPVVDALATPTTTATPTLTQFIWQANARQTYRYQSKVDLKIDTGATMQTKSAWQQINSQLSGILNVRVFDKHQDRIRLGVQLSAVDFNINGQTFPPLTTLFGTFFLVEMSPEGKPLQFNFPRYLNVANQLFVKEIVNSIQVVLPTQATATTWKTQEAHNTGDYQADYQRPTKGDIHKHKTDYLTVTLQQGGDQTAPLRLTDKIKQSEFTARLATPQSWLQTLQGEEKIDFNLPTGKLAEMVSQIQLTLSDDPQDPNLGIWRAANDYDQVLQTFATAEGEVSVSQNILKQLEVDKLRQQYANTNLTTFVNTLTGIFGKGESISADKIIPYMQEIEQYLTVYPDAALEMPALLETLNPSETLAAYLIGALEHAGTSQAQQALSTIATNPKPEAQSRAIQAIGSFNFIEHPESPVVTTLLQLADGDDSERANTALLAMGSVLKNSEGFQQAQVREELIQRLQDGKGYPATLLRAVGNSGDGSLLPNVEPYLNAPQTEVRAAAVQALRSFKDPTSLNYLVNAITTDTHQEVRNSALQALARREDNAQAVNAMRTYLPQATDTELRTNLIKFLGEHKVDDPQIVETLRQQLTQEQDRDMRKNLYNAIHR
jgi:HEAT repeat protein